MKIIDELANVLPPRSTIEEQPFPAFTRYLCTIGIQADPVQYEDIKLNVRKHFGNRMIELFSEGNRSFNVYIRNQK